MGKAKVAYKKPQQRKKEKVKGQQEREIRSSLLISDLKGGGLLGSGKEEGSKTFHKLHVFGMNGDLWGTVDLVVKLRV